MQPASRWSLALALALVACVGDPHSFVPDLMPRADPVDFASAPDLLSPPESDCLDGVDDNGDGWIDCADPSCDSQVECVPSPTPETPLGVVVDALADCPDGYTRVQPLRRGLTSTGCTGCGCDVRTTCVYKMSLYSTAGCGGSPIKPTFIANAADYDNVSTNCSWLSSPLESIGSINLAFDKLLEAQCIGIGAATRLPLQWSFDRSFCVASAGGGCGPAARCVRKRAASMCLLTEPGLACGGDYSSDAEIHNGGVSDPRTCPACDSSCSVVTAGACPTTHYPFALHATDDNVCVAAGHEVGMPISASNGLQCTNTSGWGAINTLRFEPTVGLFGGICTNDTTATGTAVATDPVRVCCRE